MTPTVYGLIAHPAGHSLSPKMQNAMMKQYQIDAHYHAFDIAESDFETAIAGLRVLNVGGFNVSTPYKQKIITQLDEISPLAQRLQAVNTVKQVGNRWIGINTDGDGFWKSISEHQRKQNVIILGTGGAARAVIAQAKTYGVQHLMVFNRYHNDWVKRQDAIETLSDGIASLENLDNIEQLNQKLKQADILINATTVGMDDDQSLLSKQQVQQLPQHCMVIDMIYRNHYTTLLKDANQRGLNRQNGLPMLVQQGALSFEYWFDKQANIDMMTAVIEENKK